MAQAKLLEGPDEDVLTLRPDGSFTFEPGITAEDGEFFSFIFKYQFVNEDGEIVISEAVLSGTATEFGISTAGDIQKLTQQLRDQLEDHVDLNLLLTVLGKDPKSGEEIELAQFLQELVLATRQNQSFEFVEFTFANRLTNDVAVEDLLEAIQAGLAEVPEDVEVVDNSNETEAVEITGTSGDDIIVAGSGGDTVAYEIGQGNDTVDGGEGCDLVSVDLSALDDSTDESASATPVNVSTSVVNGNVVLDSGDFELTVNGVEEILLTGGGRTWGDYFNGGSGNDTMVGVDFNRVLAYGLDLAAGDNSILLTIGGSTGVLGFSSALTYTDTITEDDNLYTVTLMVTDGTAVTSLTVDVVVAYEVTATPGQTLINFNSNFSGKVCAAGAKATSLEKS